jgi:DNA-binding transcriptional MerR regulator
MISLTVSQLAKQLNISADTVRYYVRCGLIIPERDSKNGYKRFHEEHIKRLHFILQAKSLGFSLADIQTIIDQASFGESPCPQVRIIMEARLKETAAKISAMQATYLQMQSAMNRWQTQPDCTPTGANICHLIEGFTNPETQSPTDNKDFTRDQTSATKSTTESTTESTTKPTDCCHD